MRAIPWSSLISLLFVVACVPDFEVDESVVRAPRILAVQASPAESRPGDVVSYRALVADPSGGAAEAEIDWSFCVAVKPLEELGPVSPACVRGDEGALAFLGVGDEVTGAIPFEACSVFGPEPSPTSDGQGGRPVDPDVTGGYRQPVRAGLFTETSGYQVSFFEHRIYCGLVGANQAESLELRRRYRRNTNPSIDELVIVRADGSEEIVEPGAIPRLSPGEAIELVVRWPDCPTEAVCGDGFCHPDESADTCPDDCAPQQRGCAGAETYLLFSLEGRVFSLNREAIRVSWNANVEGFEEPRTGVESDDLSSESRNRFVAPSFEGRFTTWIVVRDDRGGVGYRAVDWDVVP